MDIVTLSRVFDSSRQCQAPQTNFVSPQFHLIRDDNFETIRCLTNAFLISLRQSVWSTPTLKGPRMVLLSTHRLKASVVKNALRLLRSVLVLAIIGNLRPIKLQSLSCLRRLSWKCRSFRCRPQLVLTCVFPTRRPDTADVSATSCDVGFFFSVSYVVSLPNSRHVVRSNYYNVPYTPCVSDLLYPSSSSQQTITIIVLPTSLPRPCCCSFFTVGQVK